MRTKKNVDVKIYNNYTKKEDLVISVKKIGELTRVIFNDILQKIPKKSNNLKLVTTIEITLVDEKVIRTIHKEFHNDDNPTDIISFYYEKSDFLQINKPTHNSKSDIDNTSGLAELIICVDQVLKNANYYKKKFLYELIFCICHGLLHIHGYEDKKPYQKNQMLSIQEKILEQIFI